MARLVSHFAAHNAVMDTQEKYDLPIWVTRANRRKIKLYWYETPWGLVIALPAALLGLILISPLFWYLLIKEKFVPDTKPARKGIVCGGIYFDIDTRKPWHDEISTDSSSVAPPYGTQDVARAVQDLHDNPVLRK
jgi:hypothetical protein